jgi:hypothetical protein
MSPSPWQQQQSSSQKSKLRGEFMLLIAVLLLAVGGFLFLKPTSSLPQPDKMSGSAFSQLILQNNNSSMVSRQIPVRFKDKGTVDDRYTVATDPKTGEMIINDALGGMGSNNTSVEGDRARLANDMLDLDRYAESNRKALSSDAYYWLKKVARTGMKLAFGTPGLTPEAQPAIKKELLAEFHNISANPVQSFLQNSKYLTIESMFQRPDSAYLADSDIKGTNFLSIDPLSPPLLTNVSTNFSLTPSLYNTLALTTIEPSMTDLTLNTSPYVYTTSTLTATKLSPTAITSPSTYNLDPSITTSSTLSTTISSPTLTTTTIDPTISSTTLLDSTTTSNTLSSTTTTTTSTTSGPSVAEYYHDVLGVPLSTTSSP